MRFSKDKDGYPLPFLKTDESYIENSLLYISTPEEMNAFSESVSYGCTFEGKSVYLATDIIFEDEYYLTSNLLVDNYVPAGQGDVISDTAAVPFEGEFNGKGYTISNIDIVAHNGYDATNVAQGLFASLGQYAVVRNVKIKDMTIILHERGVAAPYNSTSAYIDAHMKQEYDGSTYREAYQTEFGAVGAIAGEAFDGALVENCWIDGFTVKITGNAVSSSEIAGIVGCSYHRIITKYYGDEYTHSGQDYLDEAEGKCVTIQNCHVNNFVATPSNYASIFSYFVNDRIPIKDPVTVENCLVEGGDASLNRWWITHFSGAGNSETRPDGCYVTSAELAGDINNLSYEAIEIIKSLYESSGWYRNPLYKNGQPTIRAFVEDLTLVAIKQPMYADCKITVTDQLSKLINEDEDEGEDEIKTVTEFWLPYDIISTAKMGNSDKVEFAGFDFVIKDSSAYKFKNWVIEQHVETMDSGYYSISAEFTAKSYEICFNPIKLEISDNGTTKTLYFACSSSSSSSGEGNTGTITVKVNYGTSITGSYSNGQIRFTLSTGEKYYYNLTLSSDKVWNKYTIDRYYKESTTSYKSITSSGTYNVYPTLKLKSYTLDFD